MLKDRWILKVWIVKVITFRVAYFQNALHSQSQEKELMTPNLACLERHVFFSCLSMFGLVITHSW